MIKWLIFFIGYLYISIYSKLEWASSSINPRFPSLWLDAKNQNPNLSFSPFLRTNSYAMILILWNPLTRQKCLLPIYIYLTSFLSHNSPKLSLQKKKKKNGFKGIRTWYHSLLSLSSTNHRQVTSLFPDSIFY